MRSLIWSELDNAARKAALARPALAESAQLQQTVSDIISQVRAGGDAALASLSAKFDREQPKALAVSLAERDGAAALLSAELKTAIQQAYRNVRTFHAAQVGKPLKVETQPGVSCELVSRPLDAVGLYIPGGSAPLPSTVLMLGVPAQIAGCGRTVLVSPPPIHPAILYTASLCGISEIYQVGGAQAIAALAFGTETIAPVDKIFGPGNSYVTEAKRQVSQSHAGAAIDMPAGPSEVMVIADEQANPDFIAADLLSQAEHGADSQTVLVTPSSALAAAVTVAVAQQLEQLPRRDIAAKAMANSVIIVCRDLDEAVVISNDYGPEHLIIQTRKPRTLLPAIRHAGSVFLGDWTPESVGDYASGTNHVLPTYGYVRTYSSLNLSDFRKQFTVQELTPAGLRGLGPCVATMADAEGLTAHQRAVTLRLALLEENS